MTHPYFNGKELLNQDFPFKIIRYADHSLKQPLHIHEYIQIAYVLRGTCNHQFRNKALTITQGDLFVILPGTEHGLNAIEGKEFEVVLLDFMPFLVSEQLKPFSDTLYPFIRQSVEKPGEQKPGESEVNAGSWHQPWLHIGKNKQLLLEHLLQDIQDELEHREVGYEVSVRVGLVKLLILIDREYRRTMRRPTREPALADRHPIDEVKRYVFDNYSQDIPLEHGAWIANMAPAYFSHVFRKETGQTFIDFVNEVRIERAMELLRRDAHTITQIGFQVGFHHLSHFIRTFKKRTGITPTDYKKTFGADRA